VLPVVPVARALCQPPPSDPFPHLPCKPERHLEEWTNWDHSSQFACYGNMRRTGIVCLASNWQAFCFFARTPPLHAGKQRMVRLLVPSTSPFLLSPLLVPPPSYLKPPELSPSLHPPSVALPATLSQGRCLTACPCEYSAPAQTSTSVTESLPQ
jgi:hypothetical protein